MPEFDVTVLTTRTGTVTVRVEADDAAAARIRVQSECGDDRCHCPMDWCTDDVQSDVVSVRELDLLASIGLAVEPSTSLREVETRE